jgi:hypothetical protein
MKQMVVGMTIELNAKLPLAILCNCLKTLKQSAVLPRKVCDCHYAVTKRRMAHGGMVRSKSSIRFCDRGAIVQVSDFAILVA